MTGKHDLICLWYRKHENTADTQSQRRVDDAGIRQKGRSRQNKRAQPITRFIANCHKMQVKILYHMAHDRDLRLRVIKYTRSRQHVGIGCDSIGIIIAGKCDMRQPAT